MSDKLRRTFPVEIKTGEGSQPSSAQFNAIASQARNGLGIVERAVGDLWNQSGDAILSPDGSTSNAIFAVNLARALGQQQLLSPRVHYLSTTTKYVDVVTARNPSDGNTENWLHYLPLNPPYTGGDFNVISDPDNALTSYQTVASNVNEEGRWHVTALGKLITFTPLTTATIEYAPTPVSELLSADVQTTVIPDPTTDGSNFKGLKLSYANDLDGTDGYWIYLPPRMPLESDRKVALSPDETENSVDPDAEDPELYYFQGGSYSASSNPHYRYRFPVEIQEVLDGEEGVTLPEGFLYLVDTNTGTLIEGLTFTVDTTAPHLTLGRYVVRATGTRLDQIVEEDPSLLTAQVDQTSSAYKDRFLFICPGTSATRNLSNLTALHTDHSHTGADGSQPILHSNLLGLSERRLDSSTITFMPTTWAGDDHPQYLHREGYQTDTIRDFYKNGLLGNLLLLSTDVGEGNYYNNLADSNQIFFGTSNKALYWEEDSDALAVSGTNLQVNDEAKIFFPEDTDETDVYLDRDVVAVMQAMTQQKIFTVAWGNPTIPTQITDGATVELVTTSITVPDNVVARVVAQVTQVWYVAGSGANVVEFDLYNDAGDLSGTETYGNSAFRAESDGGETRELSSFCTQMIFEQTIPGASMTFPPGTWDITLRMKDITAGGGRDAWYYNGEMVLTLDIEAP